MTVPLPPLSPPQVVRELEGGRDRTQEELLVTAQLVTQLEARLSEALGRIDTSETATSMAEGRARYVGGGIGGRGAKGRARYGGGGIGGGGTEGRAGTGGGRGRGGKRCSTVQEREGRRLGT